MFSGKFEIGTLGDPIEDPKVVTNSYIFTVATIVFVVLLFGIPFVISDSSADDAAPQEQVAQQ